MLARVLWLFQLLLLWLPDHGEASGSPSVAETSESTWGWFGAAVQIEVFQYFNNWYNRTNAYSSVLALNIIQKKPRSIPCP